MNLPDYAASIWVVGDTVVLGFPPLDGLTQGHTVAFPATPAGLELITNILRDRSKGAKHLAEDGCLTKWQVEQRLKHDKKYNSMLQAMKESTADKQRKDKEAEALLSELGL